MDAPEAESSSDPEAVSSTGSSKEPEGYAADAEDPAEAGYGQGVSGRIEDGRRFVWAAYGVSWSALLLFTYSALRRWRDQESLEDVR